MKQECVIKANSIEQAKEMAAQKLGKKMEELQFIVQKDVKKGLFGKIKEQAEVYAFYETEEVSATEQIGTENVQEDIDQKKKKENVSSNIKNKADRGMVYLRSILDNLGCKEFNLEMKIERKVVIIRITGDDLGFIIGKRGDTIYSIQNLTSLAANKGGGEYVRFIIDCGNYREKRANRLKEMANQVAQECIKENKSVSLDPMNSYERRMIHTVINQIDGVYTKSVGEDPDRRIIIASDLAPKDNKHVERWKKCRKHDNSNYISQKGAFNQPSTYDFEKEFLKNDPESHKLYGKIDVD